MANFVRLDEEYSLGKPIALDETNGSLIHVDVDDVRDEAWECICGGGACCNNLSWDFTPDDPTSKAGRPMREQLKILRDLVSRLNFVDMKPAKEIVTSLLPPDAFARVLVQPGKVYWIYVHHGKHKTYGSFITGYEAQERAHRDSLELESPAGTYRIQWIRPCDGTLLREDNLTHDGKKLRLISPAYGTDIRDVLRGD